MEDFYAFLLLLFAENTYITNDHFFVMDNHTIHAFNKFHRYFRDDMGFLLLPTASPYYNLVKYLFGWLKARIKKEIKNSKLA
jgi:hypothetical protein